MKNAVKLFGIIALVAVIGFSMAACGGDDDDGPTFINGVTVTFSLDKVDAKTFTATVQGAKWDSLMGSSGWSGNQSLFGYDATVTGVSAVGGYTTTPYVSGAFDITRTSDTVVTFVLKDYYSSVSGTISINTHVTHEVIQ